MTVHLVTMTFAVDTSLADTGHDEAFVADHMNAALRDLQRQYNPDSPILDYTLDGIRPSSALAEGYVELDAFSFVDERIPTAVLEVDGGASHCARSTMQLRVVVLDADKEGGDEENVASVNGEDVYVTDFILSAPAQRGQDGIDAQYVDGVLSQLSTTQDQPAGDHGPQPTARYITGHWNHIFPDANCQRDVRIAFDTTTQTLVAMQLRTSHGYEPATREAIADVQDSLLTANEEALLNPAGWDLEVTPTLPEWAQTTTEAD